MSLKLLGKFEVIVLVILLALVAEIYIFDFFGSQTQSTIPSSGSLETVEKPQKINRSAQFLVETMEKDIFFELSKERQKELIAVVQHFCENEWDEDSCLHHIITCGKVCFSYLPDSVGDKVRQAYQRRSTSM